MKLLAKFSVVFILVFGAGGAVAALLSYRFLQENAREQVIQQARLMMETMLSARNYTTEQIKPLLQGEQAHQKLFLPQTVPAFAATESFNYLRKRYPDYAYKEATLNPTNLRDRAVDWEADIINSFRNNSSRYFPGKPGGVGSLPAGDHRTSCGAALRDGGPDQPREVGCPGAAGPRSRRDFGACRFFQPHAPQPRKRAEDVRGPVRPLDEVS